MNTTLTIKLPHSADARHLFTVDGISYFVERHPLGGDAHQVVQLPVTAWRPGRRAEQTMDELCRVARVTHADKHGRPLAWTWLSTKHGELAVGRAELELRVEQGLADAAKIACAGV